MPLATACCERGFSTMGFVKTEETSRMRTDLLALRMIVYLNSPLSVIEMHCKHWVWKLWLWDKLKLRRPLKYDVGLRQRKKKKGETCDARALLAGALDKGCIVGR
jgi:hypothetical protein